MKWKNARTVVAALCLVALLPLTGCGAVGAAGEVVCKTAAIIPDEALALSAAATGAIAGPPGAAAGEYAKRRPISRICNRVDEEVNLIRDLAPDLNATGYDGADNEEVSGVLIETPNAVAPRLAFDCAAPLPPVALRSCLSPHYEGKWRDCTSPQKALPS